MASAKNEAKIKFTAETSEFTSAIQSANSEMSTLRAEMRLAEASFKNTGDAAEYQKTKTEILEAQLQANADKQEALTQKLEAAKAIYGEDSEEVAKLERALINAQTEEQKLTGELQGANTGLEEQKDAADQAGSSVDDMAEILINAGIADKLSEIGQAAYDMAAEFDDASAAIVEGTGASGEALEGLNKSAQNAFGAIKNADSDINSVANTLAELNTRFGVTGDEAEDLTVKIENFAHHTGTDGTKAVDSIADIMHRWGMDMDDVDGLLDDLTTANQSCQMSVDDLSGYLADNSTQFQELGYSSEEALAMLIGLINDGIQGRVEDLSKGIEPVVENNHVVILGFNESTFIILGELIQAYENQKDTRNAVVVMDEIPKTEMEDRIRIEFPDTGNLTVVCRSGSITNSKDLHRCSILTCKSIIIASHDDFETIKGILACTKILEKEMDSKAYITSVVYGRENEQAARIAGNDIRNEQDLFSVKNDRLELLMMENTISKIMTHTCRQNGLSKVFTELFNYEDHEFYISRRNKNKNLLILRSLKTADNPYKYCL